MKRIATDIFLIIMTSTMLSAADLQSLKVNVKLASGKEYTGNIVESFPENFVFNDQTLTNYFKNLKRDSIFISNDVIVNANGSLLRFSEKNNSRSIAPRNIEKIHFISKYGKPVPMGSTLVTKEEFDVVSKKLNALYFIPPDKISPNMKLGFLFLSFGNSDDLKSYVDQFQLEIEKSKQSNNLNSIVIKAVSIKKEAIKKNIYLHYNIY